MLLEQYPTASFGFGGARSVDKNNKTVESHISNQRFRVYSKIASELFGDVTFTKFEYPQISSYLMVNNKCPNVAISERAITEMFRDTYPVLSDITM